MFNLSYLRVNKNTIPLLSLFWFCNYPVELCKYLIKEKKQYCMVWNKWINEPIWSQCQMWHHNGQTVLLWPCKKIKKKENVRVSPLVEYKVILFLFFFSFLLWLAFSIQKESWSLSNDCKWNNFFSWLIM